MVPPRLFAIALITCALVLVPSGCGPSTSSTSFPVITSQCLGDPSALPAHTCHPNTTIPIPHVPVSGARASDVLDGQLHDISQGSVIDYGLSQVAWTDKNSVYQVKNGREPAYWNVDFYMPFNCGNDHLINTGYFNGITYYDYHFVNFLIESPNGPEDTCYLYNPNSASTRFAIAGSFPTSITLGAEVPFTTTYGMPLMYVYDKTRSVVAIATATAVSSDGMQATFPFPSQLSASGYGIAAVNVTASSPGYSAATTNLLSIAQSQTIVGSPFGVSVGGQTYTTINCVYVQIPYPGHGTYTQCTSGSTYNPVPVVSLYSAGQALINGARVNVGPNPTAVATYTSGAVTTTTPTGNGYTTLIKSGATRAVVANSGNNTVTILDIVNDVPVATVTVGNKPVALAVSSDSTAGYVANYADSSISRIDLTTNTVTATVAVGGNPTSVALTSAGILWVGGAGFLTEINTQNMSVTGTEAAAKNIIALGYSNSVNELIATSVDSNSNVYSDEIAPGSFRAGGTYTPVASNMISGLGTYSNQPSGQTVRAFSSTLASNSSISANQVGAPPLVVQDDWAVVTATPTGFTITDASGHVVLVNEKTPSPVTAIAVDSNLHVAYLTMPDSNTLLMVPLPGVN